MAADVLGIRSPVSCAAESRVAAGDASRLVECGRIFLRLRHCPRRGQAVRRHPGFAHRAISLGYQEGTVCTRRRFTFDSRVRARTGTHLFISTRSWEPLYGIDTLLEAFRQAYRVEPSLRLLLLGNGSQAGRVREFIEVHRLTRVIGTPGTYGKEDMPKWFREADTYVSCTQSDGTSISLLEAMATGLPVVVTDIPSNREWVVEEHNGWLASLSSADDFADRLLAGRSSHSEERSLFSARNRRIVDDRADWDRNFPKLLEMYERLTGKSIPGSKANMRCECTLDSLRTWAAASASYEHYGSSGRRESSGYSLELGLCGPMMRCWL